MSLNIRTNMPNTMRSVGEQGAFRNSMYQNDEEKPKRKTKKAKANLAVRYFKKFAVIILTIYLLKIPCGKPQGIFSGEYNFFKFAL